MELRIFVWFCVFWRKLWSQNVLSQKEMFREYKWMNFGRNCENYTNGVYVCVNVLCLKRMMDSLMWMYLGCKCTACDRNKECWKKMSWWGIHRKWCGYCWLDIGWNRDWNRRYLRQVCSMIELARWIRKCKDLEMSRIATCVFGRMAEANGLKL